MFGDFLGSCEKDCVLSQTGYATFGQRMEKLGQLFISTSGHTDHDSYRVLYSTHRYLHKQKLQSSLE